MSSGGRRFRARSTGSCRWTPRSRAFTSTARPCHGTQGAPSNYKKSGPEPPDHAIGRSRGGLTTKIHLVCDGQARALAFVLTGGQVADTSMFTDVLDEIRVPGRGPARTRPERVLADKGYPSKKNRAWLRERGAEETLQEPKRHRAVLQLRQAVARTRIPIRQDGLLIRRRDLPLRRPPMDLATRPNRRDRTLRAVRRSRSRRSACG